jgi:hypothetical protein
MIENRSVPADILLPHIVYRDVAAAIQWLSSAFGFVEHYRYGESSGAQMHLGDAWIMVRKARPGEATPSQLGCWTHGITNGEGNRDVDPEETREQSWLSGLNYSWGRMRTSRFCRRRSKFCRLLGLM